MNAEEVAALRAKGYKPRGIYNANAELRQALDMIAGGYFSPDDPRRFRPVLDALTGHGDNFLLLADYASYIACQERVDALYQDPEEWSRRAVLNVAGMGKFSSDRTIREYADRIWGVKPGGCE
jgi:starch phosphorylase